MQLAHSQPHPSSRDRDALAVARTIARDIAAHAGHTDASGEFPSASFALLRSAGLMGLCVPVEYGGFGASFDTLHDVARTLGAACLSTAMVWAMHIQQTVVLADYASPALRRAVLPEVAAGRMFIASVTTERGKGGHIMTAQAPLIRDREHIVITRDAPVVTGGAQAEGFLITMRASESAVPTDVCLVFAYRRQLSARTESGWSSLGMRGTQSVGMHLSGSVTEDQLLVPPGGFAQLAMSSLIPIGHLVWASCWLGAAEGAYQSMLDIFADPIARRGYDLHSEMFADRIARVRLQIDTAGAFIRDVLREYNELRATRALDDPAFGAPGFSIRVNEVKLLASELLFDAVDKLVQIGGLRYGYLRNDRNALERAFRDLRSAALMYGNDRLLAANGKLALIDRRAFQDAHAKP